MESAKIRETVEIRQACIADLDAIAEIETTCFDTDAFSRRQLAYLIARARGLCLVAIYRGEIAAYISLLERPRFGNLRIYSVAVHASAQGCGVGQKLVTESIAYAQKQNLCEVTLEVRTTNLPAIGLYTKLGFTPTSILQGYYHDGTDAQRMKLVIS